MTADTPPIPDAAVEAMVRAFALVDEPNAAPAALDRYVTGTRQSSRAWEGTRAALAAALPHLRDQLTKPTGRTKAVATPTDVLDLVEQYAQHREAVAGYNISGDSYGAAAAEHAADRLLDQIRDAPAAPSGETPPAPPAKAPHRTPQLVLGRNRTAWLALTAEWGRLYSPEHAEEHRTALAEMARSVVAALDAEERAGTDVQATGRAAVLTWDWREQPNLNQLGMHLAALTDGRVHLYEVDTDTDEYEIVLTDVALTPEQVADAHRRATHPDAPAVGTVPAILPAGDDQAEGR